ncbi:hypothetical protein WG66_001340 [Moniliophthora roreri]|nr:hypothetical protein WG66_001340 [Moniliophthora roreri]
MQHTRLPWGLGISFGYSNDSYATYQPIRTGPYDMEHRDAQRLHLVFSIMRISIGSEERESRYQAT